MNKTVQVMAIFCCVGLLAAACSSSKSGQSAGNGSDSGSQQTSSALGASRSEPQKPQVIEDVDYSGIGASQQFFDHSDTVIVTDMSRAGHEQGGTVARGVDRRDGGCASADGCRYQRPADHR